MRIFSFCAIVLIPPDFVGSLNAVSTTYGERNFSVRAAVRIIPAHEKTGAKRGRFRHGAAIYARVQTFLSRPIIGHTPRKLPLSSNLPVHRGRGAQRMSSPPHTHT